MKKINKNTFYKYGFYSLLVILLIIGVRACERRRDARVKDAPTAKVEVMKDSILVTYNGRSFDYAKRFADTNTKHLEAAQRIGLSHGPQNRQEAERMHKQLTLVKTNNNYLVEDLTHSLPYLVPTAAKRLDAIGAEWADILARNNLPQYRFRVTSILRSGEDIDRLRKQNSNASANSAHNYGTTFDIAYWHYDKVSKSPQYMTEDNLKLVLAQVLLNQQRAGHIYVKYERKQCCFHITVID